MILSVALFFYVCIVRLSLFFFFFNDTATTEIYTLSLHDALPIAAQSTRCSWPGQHPQKRRTCGDRKSTRLNSSHLVISYAVFCLKKKKTNGKTEGQYPKTHDKWFPINI